MLGVGRVRWDAGAVRSSEFDNAQARIVALIVPDWWPDGVGVAAMGRMRLGDGEPPLEPMPVRVPATGAVRVAPREMTGMVVVPDTLGVVPLVSFVATKGPRLVAPTPGEAREMLLVVEHR